MTYNFVLEEVLYNLDTGQHNTIYVCSLRGERDLCDLHSGHGSDASATILYWRKCYMRYTLDM